MFNDAFLIVSFFLIPFNIAFRKQALVNSAIQKLEIFLDAVFLVDMILNFITDDYSEPGQHLTNREIVMRYIRGLFVWDMAQCIPGLAVLEKYEGNTGWLYKTKILRYAQIPKTMG
jgi:hypothetical protein